ETTNILAFFTGTAVGFGATRYFLFRRQFLEKRLLQGLLKSPCKAVVLCTLARSGQGHFFLRGLILVGKANSRRRFWVNLF
ncbi:MAG TPA: hypothetical protein VFN35_12380, partial [Ktedonobacteraceae bacterium]|nr:hypothetical protein [Ktedonobacteraceae bacterium]